MEALPGDLCRITYDFSDASQLLDWDIASGTNTQLSLTNQLMLLTYPTTANETLAAVQFKLPLRPTRLAFKGVTLEGQSHMNVYLAVQWTGQWAPALGYGCIHTGTGRMFTATGTSINTPDAAGLVMNQTYLVDILMTSTRIIWTTNASSVTYDSSALYQGKDRNLVLGAWMSTVAFDDVVIEGEF